MQTLHVLLAMRDSTEALKISESMESWDLKVPTVVKSLQEALKITAEFDVVMADINFKNEFELKGKSDVNPEFDLPLIYLKTHFEGQKIDKNLFFEPFTTLFLPFNFPEYQCAVETAVYKQKIVKEFKKNARLSKDVLNALQDSLFIIDNSGYILDVNEATASNLDRKDIMGYHIKKFIPPSLTESRWRYIKQVIDSGEVVEFEDETDGIYFHHKIFPLLYNGKVERVVVNSHDITERKNAEQIVIRVNSYNRSLIEASLDPLVTIGPDGKVTDVNNATEKVTGYSRNELVGTDFLDYFTEPEKAKEGYLEVFHEGFVRDYPLEIQHRDGEVIPVLYNASVYRDESGRVVGVFAAARDITKIKEAEEALRESEKKFRTIIETAQEGVLVIDGEGITTYVNRAMVKMLGYTVDEMMGRSIYDFMDDEGKTKAKEQIEKRKRGINGKHDFRFIHKNGCNVWTIISTNPLFNKNGEFSGALGMLTDITNRKEMEVQLKSSLREKEMLLKEIHHRVKNNLMVISSLLNLQSNYIKDKDDFIMFRESQTRAKSMALIHELLYSSDDLKSINFGYYMKTLIKDLFRTYVKDPTHLKLNLDLQNVILDINTSIPLGLIVNELVSNCMKHAFPDGGPGELNISLESKDGKYILIVGDDGVGIPEDMDFRNTDSLGLELITSLTNQINGEIELNRSHGTEFKITFEEICYKPVFD